MIYFSHYKIYYFFNKLFSIIFLFLRKLDNVLFRQSINEINLYQKKSYSYFKLNRKYGVEKLNLFKKEYPEIISPMNSEHSIILSSLSQKYKFKTILEIGTFDGRNALLISKLFKGCQIDSYDLHPNNNYYKKWFNKNQVKKRIKDKLINFIQKNSFYLINIKKKYDLILIDGDHHNPIFAFDLCNSLRLLKKGGFILIDDIHHDISNRSFAISETLDRLNEKGLLKVKLFNKRIEKVSNLNKYYVGLYKTN